jgi:hypothetical protein
MQEDKDRLTLWNVDPELISHDNLDKWYLGEGAIHKVPTKAQLAQTGIAPILDGWRPQRPLIDANTRVIGVGSCFARYFVLWLAERGFNRAIDSSPYNALLRYAAAFESPAVIAQQFRWAFDEFDSKNALWIGKDKEVFEPNEERKRLVRQTFEKTDVLILTLGLSEIWYDKVTGEPLWRALTRRYYDPARHAFRVETMADTKRYLEKIEDLRRRHLPDMKVIYTVSPIRLTSTFRPVSALTANSVSKAILRSALDEFLRDHQDQVGRELFYFPSYEIVNDYFRDPFEEDNRHVTGFVAGHVLRTFAQSFCAPEMLAAAPTSAPPTGWDKLDIFLDFSADESRDPAGSELTARVAELERLVTELQAVADARLEVIEGLERDAKERLALVEQLHGVADERQKVIEDLDRAANERLALVERLHAECARLQGQQRAAKS